MIPLKTQQDISVMITRYKRVAQTNDKKLFNEEAPIDKWTNVLRQNSEYNVLCPIARALKYIKLFECNNKTADEDKNIEDGDINITDCYDMLSKLSEGETPKELNPETQAFLGKTLKETAKEVKKDKNKDKILTFVQNMNLKVLEESKRTYTKRKIEELNDDVLNPIKFPRNLLEK